MPVPERAVIALNALSVRGKYLKKRGLVK
jgi:hypothetical protein